MPVSIFRLASETGESVPKNVVVTGANSGIGLQAALALSRTGAQVVLACRSLDKARRAQDEIRAAVADARTVIIPLDVSEPESIQAFGRQLATQIGELDRRLRACGSNIIALAAHPGFANTDVAKNTDALKPKSAFAAWRQKKLEPLIPTAAAAVRPIVHAATAEGVRGGEYYGPSGLLEIGGRTTRKARVNPVARDTEIAGRLWALSEAMTGVSYLA